MRGWIGSASVARYQYYARILCSYVNFLTDVRDNHDEAEKYYKRAIEADPNNANNLGNYANFLHNVRGNHDEAEKYYKQAIEADQNHANNLGNYAVFLTDVRGNHDEAEKYYKRALEADPNNASNLGNYAEFLLRHDPDHAAEYVARAIAAGDETTDLVLSVAQYLVTVTEQRQTILRRIRNLIENGITHSRWKFDELLQRAEELEHPAKSWCKKLTEVTNGQREARTLSRWKEWKDATPES